MIPIEIRLPDAVTGTDLVTDRRGSTIWRVALQGGRTVALKYARENSSDQGFQATARLLAAREAAVLRHLDQAPALYASGVTEHGTWLAVDWIEAPSLRHHWRGVGESAKTSARNPALVATFLAAQRLADLHASGWRHADLQADHILVAEQGLAHLIDFALAQSPDQMPIEPEVTYRGALAHLTAPEIAAEVLATPAEHHIHLSRKAEVYMFGAVVFTAWTRQWPYDYGSADPRQLTVPQIHARICDLAGRRPFPQAWPQMADLISWMMDHDPVERPTATQVCSSLTELMGGPR